MHSGKSAFSKNFAGAAFSKPSPATIWMSGLKGPSVRAEIVHHIFGGTCSQYFTSPRRTSSIEVTVGFLEVAGRNGREPFCNCRARRAATMMKRYVLCSRSSGIVYIALFFRLSDMCLLTSILREAFQDATFSSILQVNRIGGLAVPKMDGFNAELTSGMD